MALLKARLDAQSTDAYVAAAAIATTNVADLSIAKRRHDAQL
jgi:hypothetical protein